MNRKELFQQSFVGLTLLATGMGLAQCVGGCSARNKLATYTTTLNGTSLRITS